MEMEKSIIKRMVSFLLGLKHDIKIYINDFNSERVIKTQTKALANYLMDIK